MADYLNQQPLKYEVFGDESTCGNTVVYGFIGFLPDTLDRALEALNVVKRKFGGTEDAEIHCRSLFAGQDRAKSKWGHLKGHQQYYLCHEVAKAMKIVGVKAIASTTDKRGLPERMRIVFQDGTSNPTKTEHALGYKQLQQYLYLAGTAYLKENVGEDNLNIWVDEDRTKIEWLNGKQQAKNIHPGIKPCGTDPGVYKPLLEVADIFAYSAARYHARERRMGKMYFKMIYKCFTPIHTKLTLDPAQWDPVSNAEELMAR